MFNYLAKKSSRFVTLLALLLCIIVGIVDGLSGPVYSLAPFYLGSVVLAAWFAGRKAGYYLSFASALMWIFAEMAGRNYSRLNFAVYWNDFMELMLFLLAALVVSALKGALERENELARTDHLTGLPNRRNYYELVKGEMSRNHRYAEPFSIAYLDIDNFKAVNDARGHAEGDRLLRQVATIMAAVIRETDTVARIGGDEFALLLPKTGGDAALRVATKVQQQLKKNVENKWPVSFSMGMVTYLQSPASIDTVIGRADLLMYEVKETGKNSLRCEVVGDQSVGEVKTHL